MRTTLDLDDDVALFDPDHVHHELAHDWFADHQRDGWATCPVTENGFVRVLSGGARLRCQLEREAIEIAESQDVGLVG